MTEAGIFLRNPHVQTIWGARCRSIQGSTQTLQRLELPDGDFVDIFWGPSAKEGAPIVVFFHGLEGSKDSPQLVGMRLEMGRRGCQTVVMHHRGCGGVQNRKAAAYHSGFTSDIRYLLRYLRPRSGSLYAVGISLGGNALLRYLIEDQAQVVLDASIAVSAPIDLAACARHISGGASRLYLGMFLRSLKAKLRARPELYQQAGVDVETALRSSTFEEFDSLVTSVLHGFNDAQDYYTQCSAKPFLSEIRSPVLIVAAQDDPICGPEALPQGVSMSSKVDTLMPQYGGHVGFVSGTIWRQNYWLEPAMANWLGL